MANNYQQRADHARCVYGAAAVTRQFGPESFAASDALHNALQRAARELDDDGYGANLPCLTPVVVDDDLVSDSLPVVPVVVVPVEVDLSPILTTPIVHPVQVAPIISVPVEVDLSPILPDSYKRYMDIAEEISELRAAKAALGIASVAATKSKLEAQRHRSRSLPRIEIPDLSGYLFMIWDVGYHLLPLYVFYRYLKYKFTKQINDVQRRTIWLDRLKRLPRFDPVLLRTCFKTTGVPVQKAPRVHTHGPSAADRSAATSFIDLFSSLMGLDSYFIEKSCADVRSKRKGNRSYYWAKDVTVPPSPMVIPLNPLIAIVDVDQYMDMPSFLCENVHPYIIYTVQPDQVSKVSKYYSYTFNDVGKLVYNVTGGSSYSQFVWNYSLDEFVVTQSGWKWWFLIPYYTSCSASYIVERKAAASDHEIIMLVPTGSWGTLGSILHRFALSYATLKRLSVCVGNGFTRLMTSSHAGLQVSTGRCDAYSSSTVSVLIDESIATLARTNAFVLTLAHVMAFVDGDRSIALPLLEYHKSKVCAKTDMVCPVNESVIRYQFNPGMYDSTAKASLHPFMSPLIDGAFAPDQTRANEEQCIAGRVTGVKAPELELTPFLVKVMNEFCEKVIPEALKGRLFPTDHDEVLVRQHRPKQRKLFYDSQGLVSRYIVKMFGKKEAYGNIKDPRAISVIDPVDKIEYSRYMYAFEKLLKVQPWYAFSKTPKQIAQRVTQVLAQAHSGSNTDFSKFDGHGSNLMRQLERMLLIRSFHPSQHPALLQLHYSQFNLKAYATFDSKYETGFSRASGSPETSLFNTMVNAFVAFLARRLSLRDGLFIGPDEAFERLGIYGGDDGLTADIDTATYIKAAKLIGQRLTIEPILRGKIGIKFLARCYSPDVWFGDETNMCDVLRQAAKLHTCVGLPNNVTPTMKLFEKIRGFALTDLHTPIIGDFCRAVISINGSTPVINQATEAIRSWLSRYKSEDQYVNQPAEWMLDAVEAQVPQFDYKRFTVWCQQCTTLPQLMAAPMFMASIPAKTEIPVVVRGEVLPSGVKFSSPLVAPPLQRASAMKHVRFNDPKIIQEEEVFKIKEKKISVDPPTLPCGFAGHTGDFSEFKALKVKNGEWVDVPAPTFDEFKAKKVADGTWVDKPRKVYPPKVPSNKPLSKNRSPTYIKPVNVAGKWIKPKPSDDVPPIEYLHTPPVLSSDSSRWRKRV